MSARVKDVMTTRVVAVRKDATFKEIAALLTEYRVSAFPVLDEDGQGHRRRFRGRPAVQGSLVRLGRGRSGARAAYHENSPRRPR